MKFGAAFILLASLNLIANGQQIAIASPDHAYTFAYGTAFSHQVDRDQVTDQLIARVTFSNYPYTTDRQPRCDETFDFRLPGLQFDPQRRIFFCRSRGNQSIPVAEYRPNLPYGGYQLSSFAQIFLVKRSGHVTAVLNASRYPREGARWVEIDDHLSLQNLLAGGLEWLRR
jgi:hypothetical protein